MKIKKNLKNKAKFLLIYVIILFAIFLPYATNAKEGHYNSEYKEYNITIKNKIYYYNGKRIRIFQDMRSDKSFVKSFVDSKGTIDIRILRDDNNKIKKVKRISKKKADKILKDL